MCNISKHIKTQQNTSKHIKTHQNTSKHTKTDQNTSKHQHINRSTHPNAREYMEDYQSKQAAVIAKPLDSVHICIFDRNWKKDIFA